MTDRLFAACAALIACALPSCTTMSFIPSGGRVEAAPDGVEVHPIRAPDGITLNCWVLPAADPVRTIGTVLYLHGVATGDRSQITVIDSVGMTAFLRAAGYRVVAFDYRGLGGSDPGRITAQTWLADSRAALSFARSITPGDQPTIAVGHSIGGVFALGLGAHGDISGVPPDAIVSYGAISGWRAAAHDRVPVLGFLVAGNDGPEPRDWIRSMSAGVPAMLVHASDDPQVPVYHLHRLVLAAAASPNQLLGIERPRGGHEQIVTDDAFVQSLVLAFMTRAAAHPDTRSARE